MCGTPSPQNNTADVRYLQATWGGHSQSKKNKVADTKSISDMVPGQGADHSDPSSMCCWLTMLPASAGGGTLPAPHRCVQKKRRWWSSSHWLAQLLHAIHTLWDPTLWCMHGMRLPLALVVLLWGEGWTHMLLRFFPGACTLTPLSQGFFQLQ